MKSTRSSNDIKQRRDKCKNNESTWAKNALFHSILSYGNSCVQHSVQFQFNFM